LESLDFSESDIDVVLGFESRKDYEKFLYTDYAYEIFGEASIVERMLDKMLNLWHISITDEYDGDIELSIANPFEFNNSIGFTCFFLSRMATRVRKFYFPSDSSTIWNNCDVLVTADKTLLENKPEGKITIKIETDYNKDIESDYSFCKLSQFLEDKELLKKLYNGND
jgi:hypothetical protein